MTNLCLIILSIWMIESTQGEHLQPTGHLQMKKIFVQDINRIVGYKKYKLADRFDKHKSFEMARVYFRYYLPAKYTVEDAAKLWGYGPEGRHHADNGSSYVRKVKQEYERIMQYEERVERNRSSRNKSR